MSEHLLNLVQSACLAALPVRDDNSSPRAFIIAAEDLLAVCKKLHSDPSTYFDMLSCITGIDNGPDARTIEIAYNLYSIPFNQHLALRTIISRDGSEVESVTSIWKTADWHEREIYDMFGVTFRNHPDMRRILMPADWEGHPLRKDYKVQEYYHGIKFDY